MSAPWPLKPLSDCLEIQNGYAFASKQFDADLGMQLIRIRDLKNGITTQVKFQGEYDQKFVVNKGDLLIGMDGEFVCYEWKGEPSLLNQRVCKLQNFSPELLPRFVYYGINKYLKEIEDNTSYTTVKHLSGKKIKDIDFPIPPLDEQQRIVSILDDTFEQITLLEQGRSLIDSKEIVHSVISNLQQRVPTNQITLGSVVSVISGSGFPKQYQGHRHQEIPFLKVSDMNLPGNEIYITHSNHTISEEVRIKLRARLIAEGSIIFPKIGGAILTNKKRIITKPSCVDNNVVALVPSEKILSEFLFQKMLITDLYQLSSKAALPSIKSSTLRNHVINLPSLMDQKKVADLTEACLDLVNESEKFTQRRMECVEELKKSVLREAFNGNL